MYSGMHSSSYRIHIISLNVVRSFAELFTRWRIVQASMSTPSIRDNTQQVGADAMSASFLLKIIRVMFWRVLMENGLPTPGPGGPSVKVNCDCGGCSMSMRP